MRSDLRGFLFAVAVVSGAALVGQASVGGQLAIQLTALLFFCGLAAAVMLHPAVAVHVALGVLILELVFSTTSLRIAATVLLIGGVMVGWHGATRIQRVATLTLLALTGWVIAVGVVLAPSALQQQGIATAFVFSGTLAACAVVSAPSTELVVLNLTGWGVVIAAWVLRHPDQVTVRGGNILAGENADGLGMLIAIGAVTIVGYTLERRRAMLPVAIFVTVISFQALVAVASRGALLSLVVGLLIATTAFSWAKSWTKMIAAVTIAFPLFWLSTGWAAARFLEASGRDIAVDYGFDLRSRLAWFAWEQGLAHPLTGVGVGRLQEISLGSVGVAASAHNTFLGLLAAAGFPALLLFLIVLQCAMKQAAHSTPRLGLALLGTVVVAGFSVEWWAAHRLAPLFMLSIALSLFVEPWPRRFKGKSDLLIEPSVTAVPLDASSHRGSQTYAPINSRDDA